MPDAELLSFFDALAAAAGTPRLAEEEAEEVLLLARVVAHGHQRRFAPVAAYAAGLLIGAGVEPQERRARVAAVRAAVEAMDGDDG